MDIKINKEICGYTEKIFFGLSTRQFFCSAAAVAAALAVYFAGRSRFGTEMVSWMCVLAAAPFALIGFFTYNGMPAEKVLICIIRQKFLMPDKLIYKSSDRISKMMEPYIENVRKEKDNGNKILKEHTGKGQGTGTESAAKGSGHHTGTEGLRGRYFPCHKRKILKNMGFFRHKL